MKRSILIFAFLNLLIAAAVAQPKKSRVQQQQQKTAQQQQNGAQGGMTQRMRVMYPTAVDMPEDVVWRRDIYREIDLNVDSNSGLYHPTEPVGKQMNLFTYVFKLALNGYIPVYEYRLDGTEVLDESAKVSMKTILDSLVGSEDVLSEGKCLLRSGQLVVPHQGVGFLSCADA